MRGTGALIAKEMRELRPWGLLCVCIALTDVVDKLLEQVDMQPVPRTLTLLGGLRLDLSWFVAFAIASSLGTREGDEKTLGFLDGLPLARAHAYAVKCAVATALVASIPTLGLLTIVALHALSSGSLDHALRLDLLLPRYALNVALIAHGVVVGAAFGFLRGLTWLTVSVVGAALAVLLEQVPRAAFLNPLQLGAAERGDGGVSVDPEVALAQLAIAACAVLAGLRGFARAGLPGQGVDLSARPALKAFASLGTAVALLTLIAVWQYDEITSGRHSGSDGEPAAPVFPDSPPAQTETVHYRISYPAIRSEEALALAARADEIFVRVHALLGEPPGEPIDVDASGSMRNTQGTAFFGRLRMELGPEMESVLAHETTHVLARRLAGAEKDWLWRRADVLNEGLATWVQRRHASDDAPAVDNLVLAALQKRGELHAEELADPELLARSRDEGLKYAAGEALMVAIVKLHGPSALPRLVRAFGDPTLPVDLDGLDLWQATFQGAGLDLGAVLDAFGRELDLQAERRAADLAALPRPRVRLVRRAGAIGAEPLLDDEAALEESAAEGRTIVLRFKPAPDSPLKEHDVAYGLPGVPSMRRGAKIRNAQVCVQAGIQLDDGVLYEPWACLPVRDAVEIESDEESDSD